MKDKIYQIQITLKGSKPRIWRRLLVKADTSLYDFHRIIQVSMGWYDAHLHQFVKGNNYYADIISEDDGWEDAIDYDGMVISDLLKNEKDKIIYEYDFGDNWEHQIILEKILELDEEKTYPCCIKGKMNCPPEDSGGVWGYYDILNLLQKPDHEEYETYKEWIGEDFDPEYFDINEINDNLKMI
jgi:hypothetical protein